MSAVLDSSALLAYFMSERGVDLVTAVLSTASLSSVNYAEVVGKLMERGLTSDQARMLVERTGVSIIAYDDEQALRTGELRLVTKEFGLSLADRACLALAERERAFVLTADRQWAALSLDIDIRLIR
jgi:ribonuclease VapC